MFYYLSTASAPAVVPWISLALAVFLPMFVSAGLRAPSDTQGPVFISEPPNRLDFSNSTGATVECSAHGDPPPTITWIKADSSLVSDVKGIRHLLPNGTLHFPPFKAELYRQDVHAGVYQCVATSSVGRIKSRPVHVRAVVQQYYEVQVYDEFVIQGNTAVLKCYIPSFVKDYIAVVSWIRDKDISILASASSGKYSISATGELYVHKVEKRDSYDTFRCQTIHRLTKEVRLSAPGRIIVADPKSSVSPRIMHGLSTVTAEQGDAVELPCAAQGLPIPTYRWYKMHGKEARPIEADKRIRLNDGFLLIENVQASDMGNYICSAVNSIGEERMDTTLRIIERLLVHIEPQEVLVDVNRRVSFTCVVVGYPVTAITWLKDGIPLILDDRIVIKNQYSLYLENVQRSDRGMYQCFAVNADEVAQGSAELRLGDVIPAFNLTFREETLEPGSSMSLMCAASGNPSPRIVWTLDDIPLLPNKRVKMSEYLDTSGNIVSFVNISSVDVQDGGHYSCIARNKAGSVQHIRKINIFGPPFIRAMSDLTAVAGKDLIVKCPAAGYPLVSKIWEKDGVLLPANRRQRVFENGTLVIQTVDKTVDEGTYTCVVRNAQGQAVRKSRIIRVVVPPLIDSVSFPRLHVLHVGARARLQCVVTQGDLPLTISWLKDGQPIRKDLALSIRRDDDFSSTVTFPSITTQHNGNYTCIATNSADSANITTQITVEVPPRWVVQPDDTSIMFRGNVTLDCRAEGFPAPAVTWKKAVGRFPGEYRDVSGNTTNLKLLGNGSLHVQSATQEDEGYYLCEASNGIGPGLSKVVQVKVHVAAHFEVKFQNKTVRKGDNAQLECNAKGDLPIVISWRKDGQMFDDKSGKSRITRKDYDLPDGVMSELVVFRAERRDSSTFSCTASNSYGMDEAYIFLTVKEPPEAPENIRIVDHSSREVHLTWSQPFDGSSPVSQYVIQYKLSSDEWKINLQNVTVPGNEISGTIRGLLPGTAYSFRILAENELGIGEASTGIGITTAEEAPSGSPKDVNAEASGSDTLIVSWKPPRHDKLNGDLLGYYIGYKVFDSGDHYSYKTYETGKELSKGEVHLTNLRKFTKYSIIVQAFNRMGAGPHSEEIIAFTDEDVPSQAPENVNCQGFTSQSLNLSWEPPPPHSHNGVILGYKVLYKPLKDEEVEDDFYEVKVTRSTYVILHDLEKWTNYSIKVLAFTRIGDGEETVPFSCRTLEDVPGAPADIKALIVSSDTILVAWKPPNHPNGYIVKYTIYMRILDNLKQETVKYVTSAVTKLFQEMSNLRESLRYEFWVTASTAVGEGESTKVISQSPKQKAPAKIASFSGRIVSPWNVDVHLYCYTVGSPQPTTDWRQGSSVIESNDKIHVTDEGSLIIKRVQRSNMGNISCSAQNDYGSDEITYELIVQAPPGPPLLTITMVTATSIHVRWELSDDGGSLLRGFVLHYKREFGEWEHMKIDKKPTAHTLTSLHCGTHYQLYMTAYNKIGTGTPSEIALTKTEGSAPDIPSKENVLQLNTTSFSLRLADWPDGGCPIRYFVVQYKEVGNREWILVSNNVQPQQESIVIPDLLSGTMYNLLITAHNDAGSTVAKYDLSTLQYPGILTVDVPSNIDETSKPFYHDISIMTPIISSVLAVFIVLIGSCIFIRHRKYAGYRHTTEGDIDIRISTVLLQSNERHSTKRKAINGIYANDIPALETKFKSAFPPCTFTESSAHSDLTPESEDRKRMGEGRQQGFDETTSARLLSGKLTSNKNNVAKDSVGGDICPYATFSLNTCTEENSHTLQLRTFGLQDSNTKREVTQSSFAEDPSTKQPRTDLYSKVVKRATGPPPTEDIKAEQGVILRPHHFPSAEDVYSQRPGYPVLAVRRIGGQNCYDPTLEEGFVSDWNVCDKRFSYMSASSNPLQEQSQVPDLLYHGTDSSTPTPNDSSPEDFRVPYPDGPGEYESGQPQWIRDNVQHNRYSGGFVPACGHGYQDCGCQLKFNKKGNKFPPSPVGKTYIDDFTIRV